MTQQSHPVYSHPTTPTDSSIIPPSVSHPESQTRLCVSIFNMRILLLIPLLLVPLYSSAFTPSQQIGRAQQKLGMFWDKKEEAKKDLDPTIAAQFKIVTCAATACDKKKKVFGVDEYAIFGGLYERKEAAGAPAVTVEESSCLGCCKNAPCVAIVHEDFVGYVGLEGMTPNEFNDSVFHKVVTEDDMDRVWSSVENAIEVMAEEEEE